MKIRGTAIGLVLLLSVLAGFWVGVLALRQTTAQQTWSSRGWLIVDFKRVPKLGETPEWQVLWSDGSRGRWSREGCTEYSGPRPDAAILRISSTSYSKASEKPDTTQVWEAFALVGGRTDEDLRNVERYVAACYSHVDLYRIEADRP